MSEGLKAALENTSNMRAVVRHSVVYGAARAAINGLDLIFIPLYTRVLTPSEYGLVAIAISLQAAVAIAYCLGLDGALFRLYYGDRSTVHAQRIAVGGILAGITFAALTLACILTALGPSVFGGLLGPMSPYFYRLLIWGAFFNLFPVLLLQIYQMRQQSHRYLTVASWYAATRGVATVIAIISLHRGAQGWAEAFALSSLVAALLAVAALRSHAVFDRVGETLREAVGYAGPQFVHQAAAWLAVSASRLVLGSLVPLAQIAVYQVALGIGQGVGLVTTAVSFAYAPAFMESATRSEAETVTRFGRFASSYFSLLIVLAGLITLWRGVAVRLIAGPAYAASASMLPIVVATFVLQGIYFTIVAPVFLRKEVVRLLPIITVLSAVIGLVVIPLLVSRIGVVGAAWSAFASNAILVCGTFFLSQRSLRMRYDIRQIAKTVAVVCGVVACSYVIPFREQGFASTAMLVALCLLLALYVAKALEFLPFRVPPAIVSNASANRG